MWEHIEAAEKLHRDLLAAKRAIEAADYLMPRDYQEYWRRRFPPHPHQRRAFVFSPELRRA